VKLESWQQKLVILVKGASNFWGVVSYHSTNKVLVKLSEKED